MAFVEGCKTALLPVPVYVSINQLCKLITLPVMEYLQRKGYMGALQKNLRVPRGLSKATGCATGYRGTEDIGKGKD